LAFDVSQTYAPRTRNADKAGGGLQTAMHALEISRLPWVATPLVAQSAPSGTASSTTPPPSYQLAGEDVGSLIVHPTAATFSITLWGSHTNAANSWVAIGTAVTAVGEHTFTPGYSYLAVSLDSVSGGAVSADLRLVRS
jgi:hypothetical protein